MIWYWWSSRLDSKKIGSWKALRGRDRDRERGVHKGLHKKNTSSKTLTGKPRGNDFYKFLQPARLKDWCFRGPEHGWCGSLRALQFSLREGQNQGSRWHNPRIPWDVFPLLRAYLGEVALPLQEQGDQWVALSSPAPQHRHRNTCWEQLTWTQALCCTLLKLHMTALCYNCCSETNLHQFQHSEKLPHRTSMSPYHTRSLKFGSFKTQFRNSRYITKL